MRVAHIRAADQVGAFFQARHATGHRGPSIRMRSEKPILSAPVRATTQAATRREIAVPSTR
ncbi:hypothetical protein I546_0347 [Mycobacterium kansasii 732]|nr:hypothetical protein I546_0347 [Mycobacterium kansasii 732]